MELKQFVSKTLEEILQGVNEAQQKVAGTHVGTVAPHIPEYEKLKVPEHISCFQNVHFEVAVSVEEKTGSEASINVLSAIVNGKLRGSSANDNAEQSKISFSVPVFFAQRTVNS